MTQNHISTLETKRATAHAWRAYVKRHETTKNPGIHYTLAELRAFEARKPEPAEY